MSGAISKEGMDFPAKQGAPFYDRIGIMERDILASVLKVEREVGERVAAERRAAAEYIADCNKKALEETGLEEALLRETLSEAEGLLPAAAVERAAEIENAAKALADALAALDSGELKEIVLKHLVRILPGNGPPEG